MKLNFTFSIFYLMLFGSIMVVGCFNLDRQEMDSSVLEAGAILEDQVVKHAIGYIEVFKLQTGRYPASLERMTKLNALDQQVFQDQLYYKRLEEGYRLDLIKGFMGTDEIHLSVSSDYWQGTGLQESNMLKSVEQKDAN